MPLLLRAGRSDAGESPENRESAFRDYDVSPDGNEFYATRFATVEEPPRQLVIVTNWAATAK